MPEALAGRLARLIEHCADEWECEAHVPVRTRERAQADLAHLHALLLELGRLAEGAGALAANLNDSLAVSYHSDDFVEAQEAKQALAAVAALCAVLRRIAGDAQDGPQASRPSCRRCSSRTSLEPVALRPLRAPGDACRRTLILPASRATLEPSTPTGHAPWAPGVATPGAFLFWGSIVNRTVFLVDGFNLFHSVLDGERVLGRSMRWLDISSLCPRICMRCRERAFFGASSTSRRFPDHLEARRPGVVRRQMRYLEALRATGVEMRLGQCGTPRADVPSVRTSLRDVRREGDRCRHRHHPDAARLRRRLRHRRAGHGDTDLVPAVVAGHDRDPAETLAVLFPYRRAAPNRKGCRKAVHDQREDVCEEQLPNLLSPAWGRAPASPRASPGEHPSRRRSRDRATAQTGPALRRFNQGEPHFTVSALPVIFTCALPAWSVA